MDSLIINLILYLEIWIANSIQRYLEMIKEALMGVAKKVSIDACHSIIFT
jgi:hypothetical protein